MKFQDFILKNSQNKRYALIALIATILQFIVFKLLYPFADFFSDSYSYIYGAYAHLDINIWPIGYSWFLGAFHHITHSDIGVVAFQYFFLELSSLYFFFTVLFFFRPSNTTSTVLFIFLFFNPLFLYISNYINSDPLFAALSLLWFTELIWILQRPYKYQLVTQAILLFFSFTIRNNAYYYPIISTFAFILSKNKLGLKLTGIIAPLLLIIPFVLHTREASRKITGTPQYSLFTGWQLANNALYIYNYLPDDSAQFTTKEAREVNQLSKSFYNHTGAGFRDYLADYAANFFIRDPRAPLKRYFRHHYTPKDEFSEVADWGKASVAFNDFGSTLIKHHPLQYVQHFMLLNTKNYLLPPLEKLEVYNLGRDSVWSIAQSWFGYPSLKVTSVSKTIQGSLLVFYPASFLMLNLIFLSFLFNIIFLNKKNLNPDHKRLFLLLLSFWILNAGFSIFATINVLRYQFFPFILLVAATALMFDSPEKVRGKKSYVIKS